MLINFINLIYIVIVINYVVIIKNKQDKIISELEHIKNNQDKIISELEHIHNELTKNES